MNQKEYKTKPNQVELINYLGELPENSRFKNYDEFIMNNQDIEKSNRNLIIKEKYKIDNINNNFIYQDKRMKENKNDNQGKTYATNKPIKVNMRKIFINNSKKNVAKYKYIDNYVKSSIYNVVNFLPKCLFFQFKRYANIYFLFITILQCIPTISPLNPITAVFPFVFVLCISMIREAFEDIKRHQQDRKENSLQVLKLNNNLDREQNFYSNSNNNVNSQQNNYNRANNTESISERNLFSHISSKDLQVGDIVKVLKNNTIPADLIILSCSNLSKTAYIETSNLDGEKNLKPIQCLLKTYNLLKNIEEDNLFRLRGKIKCIPPVTELSTFNGEIFLDHKKSGFKVDKKNFLYKGTTLKDTDWAIGVVVYTGSQSKIILNINKSNGKTSHLELLINKLMILIFCLQVCLCVVCAVLSSFFFHNNLRVDVSLGIEYQKYLTFEENYNWFIAGITSFFSYLLLFNTMIPISLVVTLEMVKYGQGFFMKWDTDMYSTLRSKFVEVNSCSLNEEMGQIKYIFSDKTGTLTTNKLVFKKAFIWDTEFGKLAEEILPSNHLDEKRSSIYKQSNSILNVARKSAINSAFNNTSTPPALFPFNEIKSYTVYGKEGDSYDVELQSGNKKNVLKLQTTRDIINQFLYCISLNQNCFINKTLKTKAAPLLRRNTTGIQKKLQFEASANQNRFDGQNSNLKPSESHAVDFNPNSVESYFINYTGESPDEIILTNSIKEMGVVYFEGDDKKKILGVLKGANGSESYIKEEFEILKVMEFNSERGMSSIIVKKEGKIYLYSKGGDGKISMRLSENNNENKQKIFDKVKFCSEKGYRVLCTAMKILDELEFETWNDSLNEGLEKIQDEKEKEKFANEKYFEIEKGLVLLGCTVVEDKLQDNVPQTIKELQSAGINIWVLTGDNLETARNIGVMCNLLPENMQKYFLFGDEKKMKKNLEENFQMFVEDNKDTQKLENAALKIQQFEDLYRKYYDQPKRNPDKNGKDEIYENYEKAQRLKLLLYIMLESIKYKTSKENLNPEFAGKLRGLIIEMACLNCILPPAIKFFPSVLYMHPLTQLFLDVALGTQAVVCCRTSPKMKSSVVELVKRNIQGAITLAIGDGANDVSMISMADVGVGLYGEEGSQAAMASDYAMGEFQFLRKLLLVHGRINYIRIAEMILYFFYKNFLFTIPQFFFAFNSAYSGQTLYDDWYVSLYNLIFTSLPLLFKALMEQDITVDDENNPFIKYNLCKTYYLGRESYIFNIPNFLIEILNALIGAVIVYFFIYNILYYSPMIRDGYVPDLWIISISQFTSIIFIVNYKLLVSQRYHTIINMMVIFLTSYFTYIAYFFVSSQFSFSKSQATSLNLILCPQFYLSIFLISSIFFFWELSASFVYLNFYINPVNLIRKFSGISSSSPTPSILEGIILDYQEQIENYDDIMRNKYKTKRNVF